MPRYKSFTSPASGGSDEFSERGSRGRGHGRHGRGGHSGGGHGGRSGRMFEHGRLRLVLLQLIATKPAHGYELIKAVEDKTGGAYSPSPGVIYPTLTLLEELGYISVEASEGSRKLYAITTTGQQHLSEQQPALAEMSRRFDSQQPHRSDVPLPILRGMENLKMALRLRLQQGEISTGTARAIAAALDQATQNIEQLQEPK
jgi:DNA-binding PadR family transcriptional regulator